MRQLLCALGSPHQKLPHVLVAGTNGKGSTAVLLASILAAGGYRTGLYTSPHLESVRERLRLDGRSIDGSELARRLERVVAVAERELGERPTYFEALTAIAFSLFADEAEIAVMEVGLGGRLDATNCGSPIAALIAEIGIDHGEILGRDLRAIAREKAGVLRGGRPAVVCVGSPDARDELDSRARQLGADWHDVTSECRWRRTGSGLELETPNRDYSLQPKLVGSHQQRNIALAVRGAELLSVAGWSGVTRQAIEVGVARVCWPGRLEMVDLPSGQRVALDAAHNLQSALALRAWLEGTGRSYRLLFGVLLEKNGPELLRTLADGATRVVLTAPRSSRAMAPDGLVDAVTSCSPSVVPDPSSALTAALDGASELVVVCGSIYLVGEVRRLLNRRYGVPTPAAELDLFAG